MATVLVVEDEIEVAKCLKKFLNSRGVSCRITPYGEEALDLLDKRQPKFMLLDDHILSGPMRGIEVLQETKRRFPKIRVIVWTAFPDDEWHSRLKQTGAESCLVKPISLEELAELLKTLSAKIPRRNPAQKRAGIHRRSPR